MSTTTRLTKSDCAELRRSLSDLGYGQAERESPELRVRRFYPVPQHLRALDPSVVLVVGPRGAGKSELFHAFAMEDAGLSETLRRWAPRGVGAGSAPGNAKWVRGYPAETRFPDSRGLAEHIRSDQSAKDLWYSMLVRFLSDELEDAQRERVGALLRPMAADLGEVLAASTKLGARPTAALDGLEQRLEREDRWVFVGYDELETLGGANWDLMARLVRGLVAFWSDYSRRWRRIRAKIFLRSDLFRRHAGMGTADFAKLAANRAELTWTDAAILGMLVKRIANTSEDLGAYCRGARIVFDDDEQLGLVPRMGQAEDAHALLERLAGEHMGAGKKKGYVRTWVLDHLRDGNGQIAPRTLVRLFEQSAKKDAANRGLRPPRVIHPTALRQALDDVSTDHVTQGINNEWPWLEGVKSRVAPERLVPWVREEIVGLLEADWDGSWGRGAGGSVKVRPPEQSPDELLDYLVELGIFRERSDGRIDVPDLYLFGLDLQRKGGVSAGSEREKRR